MPKSELVADVLAEEMHMNETDIVCTPVAHAIGKNVDWGVRTMMMLLLYSEIQKSPNDKAWDALHEEVRDA
jgi:hypothetical protein